ncbi:branched-chain amino acid ABC transporter ATP-binding protein/permease [Nocardioides campestrisoli]|uniref:branched-chain amino acid ABC transporter ATP-binding protein/permease n=1 Tax=Nocardioides campestrisoli TaxID=2736757 RepID=UPI00163DA301|nr:branched-chain amino acid ABC transporter ATP-binding protein/permease [Nocardioides campestrisoli]
MSILDSEPRTTTEPGGGGGRSKRPGLSPLLRDVLFAVTALVVAVVVILPGREGAGTSISLMQLVGSMAAMTVAAVGLNLLMGYAKLVSLGQGGFYAIGAYASAWLILDAGWHPLLAIAGALAICGGVGAVVAVASMQLRGPQFSVITLVLAILVERILSEAAPFGRLAGYPNHAQHGTTGLPSIEVFGFVLEPPMIANTVATVMVPVVVVTAVVVILSRNIARSPWGSSLSAIGESEMLAAHLGVHVFRRKVSVFVLASVLGGLGGVFTTLCFAHLQPETFDIFLTITIVLAVVFGGSGTVLGPVVGAVGIVWLEQSDALARVSQLQQDHLSDSWYLSTPGLVGVLFILTLFLMPKGIVGSLSAVVTGRRRHADVAEDDGAGLGEAAGLDAGSDVVPAADAPAPVQGRKDATAGAQGRPLLTMTGLGKKFGGLQAVAEMDLTVDRGQIHAVIGPNGAGKSTLANLLTGVYKPSAGTVVLDGRDITGLAPHTVSRAGVGRTFQTPQLFGDATVLDNVLAGFVDTGETPLWAAALKPPSRYRRDAEMRTEAARLLDLVGLKEFAGLRAGELPYGKQRALEIARALAGEPELIVLDEPAAGLLATETAGLGDLLISLRAHGYALIVVEHHMDLVARIADEVTCMDQGRLLSRGTPEQVLSDEAVVAAYLGKPMEEH